jgi:hypothetical protein
LGGNCSIEVRDKEYAIGGVEYAIGGVSMFIGRLLPSPQNLYVVDHGSVPSRCGSDGGEIQEFVP